MYERIAVVALIGILVGSTGCSSEDGASESAADLQPTLRAVDCSEFWPDVTDFASVECGYVGVPENHARPNGATLEIAVIRRRATGTSTAPDPIVHLSGGPGGPIVNGATPTSGVWSYWSVWNDKRDMVAFDQRGVGLSRPSLECPEYKDVYVASLGDVLTQAEEVERLSTALLACHDRLLAEGVDLASYTSEQNARDIPLIMQALGYDEYNLFGISYGTRLAQTAMRDVPQGIRSVILDSVVPVPSTALAVNMPRDSEYALRQLFNACAADGTCAGAYPTVEQTLFASVAAFDATPLAVEGTSPDTGQPATVMVTGTRYLFGLQQAMYRTDFLPVLPAVIDRTSKGDTVLLATSARGSTARPGGAEAMQYSVWCYEDWPHVTADVTAAALEGVGADYVRTFDTYKRGILAAVCDRWDTDPVDPKEGQPVVSDIPTLVLAGSMDPITPRYYGEQVAQTLSNSQFLLFDGYGHGVVRAATTETEKPKCSQRVSAAFFDAPDTAVDASCRDTVPGIAWTL